MRYAAAAAALRLNHWFTNLFHFLPVCQYKSLDLPPKYSLFKFIAIFVAKLANHLVEYSQFTFNNDRIYSWKLIYPRLKNVELNVFKIAL